MLTHLRTLRAWLTRSWKAVALVAVGALAGGTVLAVASVPDSNGVVHVCYLVSGTPPEPTSGVANMIVIDPSAGQSCNDREQALTLDQTGIQGTQGATGPQGPVGSPGALGTQGLAGAPGATGPQGPVGSPGALGTQGLAGAPALALPVTPTSIGQVTLKPGFKGKLGAKPANITFEPVSVTLSGRAPHASITIVKLLDTSSPTLLKALATGSEFASGTIVMNATNGKKLVGYGLTDPVIENSEIAGANNVKTQSLTLHFKSIVVHEAL
jgi:hypothetical protein